jgi:hypothetical protein
MQDDQIGRKFVGLAPADMTRQPHLIKKLFLVVCMYINNLVC